MVIEVTPVSPNLEGMVSRVFMKCIEPVGA